MTIQALPYVTLLGFLFGTSLIASRFSVGQFQPVTYIGLRFMMAGLGHAAVYSLTRHRRWPTDRRLWRHAVVLGIFGTAIPMVAVVTSLQYLPDETLTRRKGTGVALALGGAVLLAVRGESGLAEVSQASPVGYGLVLLGMVSGSSMNVYARKYMRDLDAFDVASVRMFAAALVVMPASALFAGFDLQAVNGQGYFALVYAALVGTFAAFMLAFYNIKRFGATAAAMTAYVIPVVTGIGGMLVLGETITPVMLVGMGVIISGVALINQSSAPTAD
jgi:drug/metabolite transporter (DMT)-like permease